MNVTASYILSSLIAVCGGRIIQPLTPSQPEVEFPLREFWKTNNPNLRPHSPGILVHWDEAWESTCLKIPHDFCAQLGLRSTVLANQVLKSYWMWLIITSFFSKLERWHFLLLIFTKVYRVTPWTLNFNWQTLFRETSPYILHLHLLSFISSTFF